MAELESLLRREQELLRELSFDVDEDLLEELIDTRDAIDEIGRP